MNYRMRNRKRGPPEKRNLPRKKASSTSFVHSRILDKRQNGMDSFMHGKLQRESVRIFDGLQIENCANRASVISEDPFEAYCDNFGLNLVVKPAPNLSVNRIGGRSEELGLLMIQVPFSNQNITIDANFLILSENIIMVTNGLDISLQVR